MIMAVVGNLNENEIYSSIIGGYKTYESKRNVIAHGREFIQVTQKEINELMLFVLLIICLADGKADSFAALASDLVSIQVKNF